jgi:hypothetical protein
MNPILQQIEDNISKNVLPDDRKAFEHSVEAGKHILFDPQSHQNMELIKNPKSRENPAETISTGIVGLGWVMYEHSDRTLPPGGLICACIILICEVLDFSERGLGIEITNELVAQTTKLFMEKMFKKLGVQPEQLQQAIMKGKGEIQQHLAGQQGGEPSQTPPGQTKPQGMLAQAGGVA